MSAHLRRMLSRATLGSAAGAVAAATLIAWLTWPYATLAGPIGQDPSWIAGLHLAAGQRLSFGADVVFTYGPLGFLGLPQPYFGGTSALALGFTMLVHGGIALLVLAALRGAMPLWAALATALVVTRLDGFMLAWDATIPLTVLIAAAVVLGRRRLDRFPMAPMALGLLAGPALLGKLNDGLVVFAVLGLAVVGSVPRSRLWVGLLGYLLLTAGSFAVAWLATGQSPALLVPWAIASAEIILGYTPAMATELAPGDAWMLLMAAWGLGVLAWAWVVATAGQPPRPRIVLLIMLAGVGFMTLKSGFVRADHQTQLFASLPLLAVPVLGTIAGIGRRAMVLGTLLLLFVTVGLASNEGTIDLAGHPQDLVAQVAVVATPDGRAAARETTASTMRYAYALDTRSLDLIRGQRVHVEPMETGIAFAYPEIGWRPVPVFQTYQAYTAGLDALNADALAADSAPDRILRVPPGTIDGRNMWFDAPATKVEMVCRYGEIGVSQQWQVLARVADRCGEQLPFWEMDFVVGQRIEVPTEGQPGSLVVASIEGVEPSLAERLWSMVYKSPPWFITINDGPPSRLVPASAVGPLILAVPDSLGYSSPFYVGPPITSIRIDGPPGAEGRPLRIVLSSISMAPAGPPLDAAQP